MVKLDRPLRFLQVSDLHLGGRAWPRRLRLPAERAERRRQELRDSLPKLAELARAEAAEAIFIPGDLFDGENAATDVVNLTLNTLAALAPRPIFIAPGNHDPLAPGSPYAEPRASLAGRPAWPENVHIFSRPDVQAVHLPGRPEIAILGQAFAGNSDPDRRPLARRIERPTDAVCLLLLHGSLLGGWTGTDKKLTFPFTRQELLDQDFAYVALGHYHAYDEIRDANGRIRAAYGGRPFAAEFVPADRAGACLVGELDGQGRVSLRRVPLDARRLLDLPVPVNAIGTPEALRAAAAAALSAAGGTIEDLVRFSFSGTCQPGLRPGNLDWHDLAFASLADLTALRPNYDLEALRAAAETPGASLESLFAKALLDRPGESAADRARLQEALEYGLDALHGLIPEPRHAD